MLVGITPQLVLSLYLYQAFSSTLSNLSWRSAAHILVSFKRFIPLFSLLVSPAPALWLLLLLPLSLSASLVLLIGSQQKLLQGSCFLKMVWLFRVQQQNAEVGNKRERETKRRKPGGKPKQKCRQRQMLPNFEVKVAPDDGMRRPFVLSDPFGQDSICCTLGLALTASVLVLFGQAFTRTPRGSYSAHRTPRSSHTRTAEPNGK